jgi:mannosyltransferase
VLAGLLLCGYLVLDAGMGWSHSGSLRNSTALVFGVALIVIGVQTFSIGLVGEIIIFTTARNTREYTVERELPAGQGPHAAAGAAAGRGPPVRRGAAGGRGERPGARDASATRRSAAHAREAAAAAGRPGRARRRGWWRLHGLSSWSLDGDELFSHYDVRALLAGGDWPQGARSHPLGYALMAASVAVFGEGAAALRLPSALAGLAAVAALLLMRRDALPAPQALVAGALAALSPWLVYHAQEARFYGPALPARDAGDAVGAAGAGQRPLPAVVAAVLAALCHPSALLVLPGLAVLLCSGGAPRARVRASPRGRRPSRRRWSPCSAAARSTTTCSRPSCAAATRTTTRRTSSPAWATTSAWAPERWSSPRCPRCGAHRAPASGRCSCRPRWRPTLLLLLGLLGVSVQQRYALVAVPAALLLAGRGLLAWGPRRAAAVPLAALALLAPVPELRAYAGSGDRHDFRAAADWLATHATPGDIVVADEHAIVDLYLTAYPGWERPLLHEAPLADKFMAQFPYDRREVWVLVKRNRMSGAYGREFTEWVSRWFDPVAEVGPAKPALALHDNVLSIYKRRERERG